MNPYIAPKSEKIRAEVFTKLMSARQILDELAPALPKSGAEATASSKEHIKSLLMAVQEIVESVLPLLDSGANPASKSIGLVWVLQIPAIAGRTDGDFMEQWENYKKNLHANIDELGGGPSASELTGRFHLAVEMLWQGVKDWHQSIIKQWNVQDCAKLTRKESSKSLYAVLFIIVLAFVVSATEFVSQQPIQVVETQAQLFWSNSGQGDISEANSLYASFLADGGSHTIEFDAKNWVEFKHLRLDPVQAAKLQIWIMRIEFYGQDSHQPLLVKDLSVSKTGWLPGNDLSKFKESSDGLMMYSKGDDSILNLPKLQISKFRKVRLEMKAVKKLSYVQWLFT